MWIRCIIFQSGLSDILAFIICAVNDMEYDLNAEQFQLELCLTWTLMDKDSREMFYSAMI